MQDVIMKHFTAVIMVGKQFATIITIGILRQFVVLKSYILLFLIGETIFEKKSEKGCTLMPPLGCRRGCIQPAFIFVEEISFSDNVPAVKQ